MLSWVDSFHVSQGRNQADRPVPAHAQISDVIEIDRAGGAGAIYRFAEQRSHSRVGPTRFVHDSRAKIVVVPAKILQALGKWACAQIRPTGNYHPGGLAAGMGIYDPNFFESAICHIVNGSMPHFHP
jgi:hypothetical protein